MKHSKTTISIPLEDAVWKEAKALGLNDLMRFRGDITELLDDRMRELQLEAGSDD